MSGMGQKLSSRRVRKTSAPSPQADDGKGASAKCHKKSCSVKVVAGAEATYTEHPSDTSEKPRNRSKSWARNHLDLQLHNLLETVIGSTGGALAHLRFPTREKRGKD